MVDVITRAIRDSTESGNAVLQIRSVTTELPCQATARMFPAKEFKIRYRQAHMYGSACLLRV